MTSNLPLRLLLISANPGVTDVFRAAFETTSMDSAVNALECAREQAWDLIVFAQEPGVLRAADWSRLFKNDDKHRHVPVFLWATTTTVEESAELASRGVHTFGSDLSPEDMNRVLQEWVRITPALPLEVIHVGDLTLDIRARSAAVGDERTLLTRIEFELLWCLAANPNQVITRDEIRKRVWREETDATKNRTIDVHVRALRKKIPLLVQLIHSVYGVGYRLTR